jgi:4-aminobutyrate aminotransferase-like enzyme
LIEHGFLVGQKEKVLRFMPPLVIKKEHIDQLINTLRKLL